MLLAGASEVVRAGSFIHSRETSATLEVANARLRLEKLQCDYNYPRLKGFTC